MARSAIAALVTLSAALFLPYAGPIAPAASVERVVVGFTRDGYAQAASVEADAGALRLRQIPLLHADVVEVPGDALASLRDRPGVLYAELDARVYAFRAPDDEFLPSQWSVVTTHAEHAWDLTTGSPNVVVGVLDTGVDGTQPDLAGKLVAGFDYVNNDQDPADDNGHGTAVAGIIAANTNNGVGVAGYCWSCRLMPVKVLGADGTGFESALAQGMVWAVDHGARVVNLSLGGPTNDAVLAEAAQYASAHGVLVVAAAGNEGAALPDYPAALPNVLSVGASNRSDQLYSFSNAQARVAAPGENSTVGKDNYVSFLGTSSAAPVVSGIAGLAFSLVPSATPASVQQALESTAVPIAGVVAGRVDAYAALHALSPQTPASDGSTGSRSGAAHQVRKVITGRVRRGRPARIVLTTGSGRIDATGRLRGGGALGVRLTAGGQVVARRRGTGRVSVHATVGAGRVVILVGTASRSSRRFSLTLSYPAQ